MSYLNKFLIKNAFDRAAKTYDRVSVLQQTVGKRLIERLDLIQINPGTILDLGCGTGFFLPLLKKRYPHSKIIGLDISEKMLKIAKKKLGFFRKSKLICADSENFPLPEQSVDLVFANFIFEWCDIQKILYEIKRVLNPNGIIIFSTLGPDSFKELKISAAESGFAKEFHQFMDMHDMGDNLIYSGLADPVLDIELFQLVYKDVSQLLYELKNMGMRNCLSKNSAGLKTKKQIENFKKHYENLRNDSEKIPLTFEVVYGHAWGTQLNQKTNATPSVKEFRIGVDQITKIKNK